MKKIQAIKNRFKFFLTKRQKKIAVKSGFSLIEMLISIFVFSFAMTMVIGSFSGFLKTYANAKKAQRSSESAQYAINLMAKTIRSSTISQLVSGDNKILIFDNLSSRCVAYKYLNGKLQQASVAAANVGACSAFADGSFLPMANTGEIAGAVFDGAASAGTNIGRVTMSLSLSGGSVSQLQSSVSLRQ